MVINFSGDAQLWSSSPNFPTFGISARHPLSSQFGKEFHKNPTIRTDIITLDKMTINVNTSLLLLLVTGMSGTTTVKALLRGTGAATRDASKAVDLSTSTRNLMAADFVPLACNNNFAPCIPWMQKFGTELVHSNRLFIDCGECVALDDHPGPVLTLLDGIDIRGKLQIKKDEDDTALIIKATIVVVQGELEMSATKAVDGKPLIKFLMEGQENKSFTPIEENTQACGGNDCSVGKKAITVAGGKVDGKNNCAR